jgi:hypothetical protein
MNSKMQMTTKSDLEPQNYPRDLVLNAMNEVVRRIDQSSITLSRIIQLGSAMSIWLSEEGIGLQPIESQYWKEMARVNELTSIGFDEMVHEGLDMYWQTIDLESYEEEDEFEDK